jgi:hypothetical protein
MTESSAFTGSYFVLRTAAGNITPACGYENKAF